VRSIGNGFIIAMGLTSTMFIPWIINISKEFHLNSMIVFGIFGLIAAYSFKYTKETLHEDLPSTIEELSTENGDIMDDMNNSSFGF